eukprot:5432251-Amphidinium_carterae.2
MAPVQHMKPKDVVHSTLDEEVLELSQEAWPILDHGQTSRSLLTPWLHELVRDPGATCQHVGERNLGNGVRRGLHHGLLCLQILHLEQTMTDGHLEVPVLDVNADDVLNSVSMHDGEQTRKEALAPLISEAIELLRCLFEGWEVIVRHATLQLYRAGVQAAGCRASMPLPVSKGCHGLQPQQHHSKCKHRAGCTCPAPRHVRDPLSRRREEGLEARSCTMPYHLMMPVWQIRSQ